MKITKLLTAIAATLLGLVEVKAQSTFNIPGETGASSSYLGTSVGPLNFESNANGGGTSGNITFSTNSSTTTGGTLNTTMSITPTGVTTISGTNSQLILNSTVPNGTNGPNVITFQSPTMGGSKTYSLGAYYEPTPEDDFFHLYSGTVFNSFGLHTDCANTMFFGTDLYRSGYYYLGQFAFNGSTAAPSLLVSPTLSASNPSSLFSAPTGNIFGVNGGSYLNGNVTIPSSHTLAVGGTSTLTGAVGINTTPGTYQLAVTGTSNFSGNVTIPNPNTLSVGGTSALTGAVGINTTPGAYQLAVTGTSNLNGSVTIPANTSGTSNLLVGLTAAPTNSPNYNNSIDPTTYNSQYTVAVAGNANFQGAVVIGGSPAYFALSGSNAPNGPWANTNFYSLYVAGGILTEQVQVALSNSSYWADFVFDKNYKLTPLAELESFIQKNHHLPEIPSAEEVVKSGINVAEMDAKLLQKIEELTLYVIEIEKNNKKIQKENQELKQRVSKLEVK